MNGFAPEHGWLIACLVMLAIEAFGVPGIGFLFAGLAAMAVALLVHLEIISRTDWLLQLGAFGALAAMLAALLWRKLIAWRTQRSATGSYNGMIGDMATIGKGGLETGKIGQASWSGTTMNASIDPSCNAETLAEGTLATITAVKGNQLIVAPKDKAK